MTITFTESFDIDVQTVFEEAIRCYGDQSIAKELLTFLNGQMDFKQAYMLRDMIAKHINDNE